MNGYEKNPTGIWLDELTLKCHHVVKTASDASYSPFTLFIMYNSH